MKMNTHFFVSANGDLFDRRQPGWANNPLRRGYATSHTEIDTTMQLRATLRAGRYVWPGGYPLHFITSDGESLSFETVRKNYRRVSDSISSGSNDGWRVVGCMINWGDTDLRCAHSNARIESAYGEESKDVLKKCAEYLECIPETAAGGDDEAARLAKLARKALENWK